MTDEKKSPAAPDIRDLQNLWQSALGQIDEIRDVIVRGSQAGKAKLDAQLLKRTKASLLQQLGERLVEEHKRGAMPLPEGAEDLLHKLEETEAQILEAEQEAQKAFAKK